MWLLLTGPGEKHTKKAAHLSWQAESPLQGHPWIIITTTLLYKAFRNLSKMVFLWPDKGQSPCYDKSGLIRRQVQQTESSDQGSCAQTLNQFPSCVSVRLGMKLRHLLVPELQRARNNGRALLGEACVYYFPSFASTTHTTRPQRPVTKFAVCSCVGC